MLRHSLWILVALAVGAGALNAGEPPAVVPRHGGVLVDTHAGRFELVYDAEAGSLVVYALTEAGLERTLPKAPVLLVGNPDGPRKLELAPVGTGDAAWKVSDASLRDSHVSCKLTVEHEGSPLTIELCAFLRPHEGLLLLGGDTLRLVATCPVGATHVALRPFKASDVALLGTASPEVLLVDEGREIELPLLRGSSIEPVWLLNDASPLRNGSRVIVRARLGDRTVQTQLQLPTGTEQGLRGGTVVPVGASALRLEIVREPAAGRLCLFVVAPTQGMGASVEGPPQLLLGSESTRVLTAVAVRDAPDAWILEHEDLRGAALHGRLRLKVGGKAYEIQLPAAVAAQGAVQAARPAQPQAPKGSPSPTRR